MKTLYVGGKHFFNRFGSLDAAVKRAEHDDVIELMKDEHDVNVYITKNITINGHGHVITPANGKPALDCASFVTLNDLCFKCQPRTNAVIIRGGGRLNQITTAIVGPARALYPTIVQRGGRLTISGSEIMHMETYERAEETVFELSRLLNYYGGFAYLNDNDYTMSMFRTKTIIRDSDITCAWLGKTCEISNTVLRNFNKAVGTVVLNSCELKAAHGEVSCQNEPMDGPLAAWIKDVVPYALHIAGGKVTAENFSSNMGRDCIGFYMSGGSLDIRSTKSTNDQARHLIKGGSVVFNNVLDDGFYEIRKARCGVIRSRVNTSSITKSAMDELDSMIGLTSVKRQMRTIMNTIRMNAEHPEKDFGFSHHMVFAGDPGTGKTTVAKLVAQALFEIGAIPENKYMEVPASQLIKGYVGQTGEHVEAVMRKALGGVLFIDEAYELMVKEGENSFNNDALTVLLRYLEDHRNDLVVIAAGYEKEMKQFLSSNVGLTRRFQWISFEDYTGMEMADIFLSLCKKYSESFNGLKPDQIFHLRKPLAESFQKLTDFYLTHPDMNGRITNGGNGGLVRNVFQQVVFARNNRVAEYPETTTAFIRSDLEKGFMDELTKAKNVTMEFPPNDMRGMFSGLDSLTHVSM